MPETCTRGCSPRLAPAPRPGVRPFWAFLAFVSVGGPLIALWLAVDRRDDLARLGGRDVLIAAVLVIFAASTSRLRFSIGRQVHASVSTVAMVAMLILLPVSLPGVLAPLAKGIAELARGRKKRIDPVEVAFNVGQTAWCAVTGAMVFSSVQRLLGGGPSWLAEPKLLTATVSGFLAFHVINCGFVAGIAGLQLNYNPIGLWLANLHEGILAHATLAIVAFAGSLLIEEHPLALAALGVPLILVDRALRASARLRADTHAALNSLVEVVELRDPYTAGHSLRVAETARNLALRLGMSPDEADRIQSAGRVHDIGKVAIDPAVLMKPGKLDPAEWEEMRRHPELGAQVIARFAAYGDGYLLVRHHHESWDGSGYPDGLSGEEIPFGARILAVADTFDALTSNRPYRSRMDIERALAILTEGAGRQWDPQVVAALVEHVSTAPVPVEQTETAPVAVPAAAAA